MPYSKQCPFCGETLTIDEVAQAVRCGACGSAFAPEELRVQSEEEVLRLLGEQAKEETERDGFLCENCGAQLIADETAGATFCCFCGAPAMQPAPIPDTIEPELALPFAVDRREAQDRFVHWFGRKKLISPAFLETAKAGRISGVYVPFWLFDCAMETQLHAVSSTTETVRSEQDEAVTAKEYYHYRAVKSDFTAVPTDASERIDARLMTLLGPFDLTQLEPFDPACMEGIFAQKNSLTLQQAFAQAREQLEAAARHAAQEALETQSYARVSSCRHCYEHIQAKYALLPVWIMTCSDRGFTHQFFMNGQTGKIVGETPLSLSRSLQWFGGIAAAAAAAGELIWLALDKLL
ncbi:MAG: hypothetical protein IJU96_10250 [Clostridia bacterium]|nr:hypothetical protein [Clostridia bacterium]